jgi:HEAT repeat protein
LGLFGPPSVDKLKAKRDVMGLLQVLEDTNRGFERWRAAEALGNLKDPRAVEPLIRVLREEPENIGYYVPRALGEIGDDRAVDTLVGCLKDGNHNQREAATTALVQIGGPRSVEALIAALDKRSCIQEDVKNNEYCKHPGLCLNSAVVLGKLHAVGATEPLISMLGCSCPLTTFKELDVHLQVEEALRQIGPSAVEPLIGALQDGAKYYKYKKPLSEPIFQGRVAQVQEHVARLLGTIKEERVVEPLLAALKSDRYRVRAAAMEALGNIRCDRAVDALVIALKESDTTIVTAAAEALGKIGDPRAVDSLILALKRSDNKIIEKAVEALGMIDDARVVDPLIHILRLDASPLTNRMRRSAAHSLIGLSKRGALEAKAKQKILAVESIIMASHVDRQEPSGQSSDCTTHHTDTGGLYL